MKAIVLTEYGVKDVLKLQEVDKPVPEDDELLIKVCASSVNDWDWGLMRGKPFVIRLMLGLRKPKVHIPGVDIAGIVEAVGSGITKFQPGDEVYGDLSESGFGGFAEYACTDEKALSKKPANMTFEEAASIPHAAMLAKQGLIDDGHIQSGQKILINGAGGGVGTLGIQIARLYDVHVTGVDSGDKSDMLTSLGYDRVLDYRQIDFTLEKNRYDLILDVKTNRPISRYARSLRKGGRYVTVGGSMPRLFQAFVFAPLISLLQSKSIRVLGLKPNKDLSFINELFEAGKLKPVIDGPYQLSDIPELMQYFGEGRHQGKVVVSVQ
ncbi:MAG: zinc-binding dehydrogenase [Candidatus Marinimicrobia bacterium]|nr:zinc-binding dehydrogenase [Candidatus Neomarinimicrobiota bacterium]